MAGVARENQVRDGGVSSRAGTRPGRTFDAVIAAQAWPWVDPVAGAAAASRGSDPKTDG